MPKVKKTTAKKSKVKSKTKAVAKKSTAKTKVKAKVKAKTKVKAKARTKAKAKPKTTVKTKPKAKAKTKTPKAKAKTKMAKTKMTTASKTKTKAKTTVRKLKVIKPEVKKTAMRKPAAARKTSSQEMLAGTGFMGIPPYQPKAKEEYMSEPQRAHFRRILMTWKQALMEEVDRTVHHMKDDAANFPDPNDRATQEEEFSLELRTRDRERKLIKKIEEAIESIESDEYGFCEMCGVDIGIRRLEARPTATLCIDCKTMDEIRERQGAA